MRYERTGERTARLELRIRPEERALFDAAATDTDSMSASDWARRVLAAISNGRDIGDVTTLANPEIVEEIERMVQG